MFSWLRGRLASVLAFFYIVYQHGPIGSILYLVVPIVTAGLPLCLPEIESYSLGSCLDS
jgi:hypothetical protein